MTTEAAGFVVTMTPIGDVKPYPNNPRKNDRAIAAVAASIKQFGFRVPIVVDEEGVILTGHTRHAAAISLGYKEVPVHVARGLTPEQARAYRIADNKVGEIAKWDDEKLGIELKDLPNVDWTLLGFRDTDVAKLLGLVGGSVSQDDVPPVSSRAVSRRGDLWILGDHRLLNGSSTDEADVEKVMMGERALLCATDPPYIVSYTGKRPGRKSGEQGGKDWSDTYVEVPESEAASFYAKLMANIDRATEDHAALYCWHASKTTVGLVQAWEAAGFLPHQLLVWVKPTFAFTRMYWQPRHEVCVVGWKQGNMPKDYRLNWLSSVWDEHGDPKAWPREKLEELVALLSDTWTVDYDGKARWGGVNEHPTQKPVEIFARSMIKHTVPGDICFEAFSGSGTQIVAGEQLKRRVRAIELQSVFVDVAIRRWQNLTGKTATLHGDGRTWSEVAKVRREEVSGAAQDSGKGGKG